MIEKKHIIGAAPPEAPPVNRKAPNHLLGGGVLSAGRRKATAQKAGCEQRSLLPEPQIYRGPLGRENIIRRIATARQVASGVGVGKLLA